MEVIIMSRAKYSAEFKSRIVLAIIQGDKDFNTICSENNLNPGMVRKWADNIMIERWFRSLKTEQIYTHEYETPRELRRLVAAYIDEYNRVRPHEALDYETPDELYYRCFAS